jgi:hypothetical protein
LCFFFFTDKLTDEASVTNTARTVLAASIVTVQGPVVVQPEKRLFPVDPLYQPSNASRLCGSAVSVTSVSTPYVTQSLPETEQLDVTVPDGTDLVTLLVLEAGVSRVTVRLYAKTNVAVTDLADAIVMTQVPVLVHPEPDQPEN